MSAPRLTLAEIRTKYPEPRRAGFGPMPGQTGKYCVGGAYCLAVGADCFPFPSARRLSEILHQTMPALSLEGAEWYAAAINRASDDGDFDEAWEVLGEALEWGEAAGV